jgi:protein-S-isoprenylcysteine O-methyltransferase Ste14
MDATDRPNRVPWPPLLVVATLAAGALLSWVAPLPFAEGGFGAALRILGLGCVAAALSIDVWAFRTLRRHSTTILPHEAASALVTQGPFGLSRNPIYLANLLLVAGLGLALGRLWFVLLLPALALALQELAIKREERHLEARFGAAWRDYAARVRRWV